jgi:hypothetical protein
LHDIQVGHPQDAIPLGPEKGIPHSVPRRFATDIVRVAIDLDEKLAAVAAEVDVIAPAKFDLGRKW